MGFGFEPRASGDKGGKVQTDPLSSFQINIELYLSTIPLDEILLIIRRGSTFRLIRP